MNYRDNVRREQDFLAAHPEWRLDRLHSDRLPCSFIGVRESDGARVETFDLGTTLDLMEGLARAGDGHPKTGD